MALAVAYATGQGIDLAAPPSAAPPRFQAMISGVMYKTPPMDGCKGLNYIGLKHIYLFYDILR